MGMMAEQLLEYCPYLLAAYLAAALGMASPGPNFLAVVGASMNRSRRAGMLVALGVSTGSIIWAVLGVLGLTALLANFAWFATVLRVAGGLYLIWLASKYLRSSWQGEVQSAAGFDGSKNDGKMYLQGLGIQMSNPKAAMYWVAVMSLVFQPGTPDWVAISIVLGCGVLSISIYGAWALIFSSSPVLAAYQSWQRIIDASIGTILGAMGVGLILSIFRNGSKA